MGHDPPSKIQPHQANACSHHCPHRTCETGLDEKRNLVFAEISVRANICKGVTPKNRHWECCVRRVHRHFPVAATKTKGAWEQLQHQQHQALMAE